MYRTIDTAFWTDPVVKKLAPPAKLLFLYLITNNHTHVGGIYYLPDVIVGHETGLDQSRLDTLFNTLSSAGLSWRDKENEVVWVVNMLRHQGAGEKILRSVSNHLKTLHKCPFIQDFLKRYPGVKRFYRDRVSDGVSRGRIDLATGTGVFNSPNGELTSENGGAEEEPTEPTVPTAPGEPKSRKSRQSRQKPQPSGEHQSLIAHFMAAWEKRYGLRYTFAEGKDGKLVKTLLTRCRGDVATAFAVVDAYLSDDEPWIVKDFHPLGILVSKFNRFHAKARSNGAAPRTLSAPRVHDI